MKDFPTLKVLDKCQKVFRAFGIDYEIMRKILQVKLTMDQRRVPTIFNEGKNKEGNQFIKSLGIYALMSIILIPFLLGDQYIFQMSLVFGIIMFIVMTSMISDFSSVLLDVRDKVILGTKPINSRTISAAKVVHVAIYLFFLMFALTAVPLVVGLINHGIVFFLLFLIELVLLSLLVIILTALIYIFVLKVFDGERLKDMINYVQILLSVTMIVGYQLVIRSFEFIDLQVTFEPQWWQYLVPPIWYGAAYEFVLNHNLSSSIILLTMLGLVIPIVAIFVYLKLIPSFERNLEKLLSHSGKNKRSGKKINKLWAKILCTSKEERTFFRFANQMLGYEREFKLKVYPTIGFSLVFPFIFLLNELRMRSFAEIAESNMYLTIYFCLLMVPNAIHMLKFSENYKGSWIYQATPIKNKAVIYTGTIKAFLTKLFIPVFIILSVIYIVIFSVKIIPALLAVLLTASLFSIICYKVLNQSQLPFSDSFEAAQQTETVKNIVLMLIIGAFGAVHYLISSVAYGDFVYLGVLLIGNFLVWKTSFR